MLIALPLLPKNIRMNIFLKASKYTYTTSFSSQCTLHIYQLKLQFYDLHMENTTLNSQLRRILQMCHQMDLLSLHISENILSMLEYFGPNFDLRVKHLLPSNLLQFHIESG
ncbi:uncharacterized protein LOC111036878 isoform X2 [Myzus persicae]|uniref:uncharacterized protein LOC111036878 isoform X2 n=1 Tax=Myzus persicae TaxID=13164 RepID=UPI000B932999|nr:uncharacterized protein LOC111036878 isoform X2 [Myzus persicae]